ncbi:MAG: glycosyltransferase family 39 protein [Myxococcales bacterium]|nr:MAG: glycosyltransferase family 39 protein [Myxococcales bacterium]
MTAFFLKTFLHTRRLSLLLALGVGLALRIVMVFVEPITPTWDGIYYDRIADDIAEGDGYTTDVFTKRDEGHASAMYPVGFPAVLAALRSMGVNHQGELFFQALCSAFLIPLVWFFGRRLGGIKTANLAAWLIALWPGGILASASYMTEPLFAFVFCLALLPLWYARRKLSLYTVALSMVLFGLAAYVRPTALIAGVLLSMALAMFVMRKGVKKHWKHSASLLAVAWCCLLLPLAPWAWRNSQTMGAPVLVSTNGGQNLLLGTYDFGGFQTMPNTMKCSPKLSEVEKTRCYNRRAMQRIRKHPMAWLGRGLYKTVQTFSYETWPAYQWLQASGNYKAPATTLVVWVLAITRFFFWIISTAAASGLAFLLIAPNRRYTKLLVVVPLLAVAAVHFVYISGGRYHYPLVPYFSALAAYAMQRFSNLAKTA